MPTLCLARPYIYIDRCKQAGRLKNSPLYVVRFNTRRPGMGLLAVHLEFRRCQSLFTKMDYIPSPVIHTCLTNGPNRRISEFFSSLVLTHSTFKPETYLRCVGERRGLLELLLRLSISNRWFFS